ncbi:MAG TPA: hypothetical protein VM553_00615 [Dongiaceae bacterium]|nr:hypothetical protein [Dongiaceae bacterium]
MTILPSSMRAITDFTDAREAAQPRDRLETVRQRALQFREWFMDEPEVLFYKSINLVRVPYPTWYAYTGVFAQSAYKFPYIHILNRLFVVQYRDMEGQTKTLLFSPSDIEANRETPFFKRLAGGLPGPRVVLDVLAPVFRDVETALREIGIAPRQVDYISYDHLHTQDVRRWIGTAQRPGIFPNAKLLVHRQEWASTLALLPCQADWYCPNGIDGLPAEKVIGFEGSLQLGRGVALIYTPGHTEGNHSLAARVADGIRVTSENGVGADAYAPQNSRINAIRRYAQATGNEVILNGNTLEGSNDQYISMVMEKTIAGPSTNPDYPNCAPSSEATPYWLIPGHQVSHLVGEAEFGRPVTV